MKIAAHKTYLVYAAFWCSEKLRRKVLETKNGTKAVLQGWAAAFVPYMLSFTY